MDSIIKSRLESDLELTVLDSAGKHAKSEKIKLKILFPARGTIHSDGKFISHILPIVLQSIRTKNNWNKTYIFSKQICIEGQRKTISKTSNFASGNNRERNKRCR